MRIQQWSSYLGEGSFILISTVAGQVSTMMTSSNENIFRVTGPSWRESTGYRWIPFTKAHDAELCYFFDLCLNKRLSKQSIRWWFETQSRSLWRQSNAMRQHVTYVTFSLIDLDLTMVPIMIRLICYSTKEVTFCHWCDVTFVYGCKGDIWS